jgi:hypothetical protein
LLPRLPLLKDPQQLYLDWEHAHWAAQDVDLARDPADWAGLEENERNLLYFALSSLMVAEERISTQFVGLVLAQDDEEEGSFLSTQLVDEVRHMQFYKRFQDEVIADPGTIAAHVARSREVLGDPFKKIFDGALVQAHDRLCLDNTRSSLCGCRLFLGLPRRVGPFDAPNGLGGCPDGPALLRHAPPANLGRVTVTNGFGRVKQANTRAISSPVPEGRRPADSRGHDAWPACESRPAEWLPCFWLFHLFLLSTGRLRGVSVAR